MTLKGNSKGMNNEEKRSFSTETLHFSLFTIHSSLPQGGVAQLGEHLPCKQGVMGSNPIISTSSEKRANNKARENERHREKLNGLIAQVVRARA